MALWRCRINDYVRWTETRLLRGSSISRFNIFPLVQASQSVQDDTNDKKEEECSKDGKLNGRAKIHCGSVELMRLKLLSKDRRDKQKRKRGGLFDCFVG